MGWTNRSAKDEFLLNEALKEARTRARRHPWKGSYIIVKLATGEHQVMTCSGWHRLKARPQRVARINTVDPAVTWYWSQGMGKWVTTPE